MIHHRGAGSYLEESTSRVDTHHQQSFSTSKHLQVRDRGLSNFDVLIRIVDQPTGYTSAASAAAESAGAREEVSSVFTEEEKLAQEKLVLQSRMADLAAADTREQEIYEEGGGALPVVCLDAMLPRQRLRASRYYKLTTN